MIWGLGAAALAGGAYYYFQENPDEKAKLEAKARKSEEEAKIKSIEAYEAAKVRGENIVNKSKLGYEDAKVRFFLIIENARYVWFTEHDDSLLPRISTTSQLAKHVQQHTKPKLRSMPTKHPPNPPLPKKPTK